MIYIEPVLKNPIKVHISSIGNFVTINDEKQDYEPLKPGVVFGSEHYGFSLIRDVNGEQEETLYPTQCRIYGMGIENNKMIVCEDGKSSHWHFSLEGEFIDAAKFLENSRRDIDYLGQQLGSSYRNQIEEVNSHVYKKQR